MSNEEKLVRMLKYVSEHNDFYKKRIREYGIANPLDITQWPVLTRKELQENRYNMFSDGYKAMYFSQQLRRQCSSGSSGIPVSVYWDYKDWYASNLPLWRERAFWYRVYPKDKCAMFTLNAFNAEMTATDVFYVIGPQNILSVNVSLIQKEEQYIRLVNIINDFEPDWLYIQPFVLNKIIQCFQKYNIPRPLSLKYIESVGELLTSDLRRRAKDFFNVPIASMYGSEEMNGIAFETSEHSMDIFCDNVFVEVQKYDCIDRRGQGEAIITNLNNKSMPLVRYLQGDIITLNNCDRLKERIEIINGRSIDAIKINNYEINGFLLLEIVAQINNELGDVISESKYIYIKSLKELRCYAILNEKFKCWANNIKRLFCDLVNKKFNESNEIKFTIVITTKIDDIFGKKRILSVEE